MILKNCGDITLKAALSLTSIAFVTSFASRSSLSFAEAAAPAQKASAQKAPIVEVLPDSPATTDFNKAQNAQTKRLDFDNPRPISGSVPPPPAANNFQGVSRPAFNGGSVPPSAMNNFQGNAPRNGTNAGIPHGEELVSLNFPDGIPLGDLVRTVGMWTGKNLILTPASLGSAQISIIIPNPITKEQAYQAFLSALNMTGYTALESGNLVKIMQINAAKNAGVKTYFGAHYAPQSDEIINHIIPLSYIDASMVVNQLRPVLGTTQFAAFTATNSLLVTDTGNRIRRLLEIIRLLDTKTNQPQVAMVPLHYVDAKDASTKITEIYNVKSGSPLYLQKVVVNERANSLILVGPSRGLDDVVRFVHRLDQPTRDNGGQAQIRIRQLNYADAEKLAATLQTLAQAGNKQQTQRSPFLFPQQEQPKPAGTVSAAAADLGNVKITADKPTNSLIIQGSQAAYNELEILIKQLDRRRAQIYVETDIVDVNITDGLKWNTSILGGSSEDNGRALIPYGFNVDKASAFTINSGAAQTAQAQAISSAVSGGTALLGILGGKSVSVLGVNITPGALILALKNDSNSTVLQTPSILVSDNEQAKFQIVNTYTYVTTAVDPVTKASTGTPQKQEVNTTLNVTPQISQADFINMKIDMQLDNAGPTSSDPQFSGAPTFIAKRSATTAVTVQNSQTIVIGGLNYEKEDVGESGIPLLKDIPFIGWLFKSVNKKKDKNNLMVFIRPYVIRGSEDFEKIYNQKIQDRDAFLKAFYGRSYRDEEFYKKLPTLEEGKAPPPPASENVDDKKNLLDENSKRKLVLPSEDPDPISAPSGVGGGASSGNMGFAPGAQFLPLQNAQPASTAPAPSAPPPALPQMGGSPLN